MIVTDRYQLLRFDPWAQRFQREASDDLPSPPLPITSIDIGAAVWVGEQRSEAALFGRRFATRNAFAQDLGLIGLVHPTSPRWPLHLAPGQGAGSRDQGLAELVPREISDTAGADFVLSLANASVWVTDAKYADFSLQITLESGPAPALALNSTTLRCAWPEPTSQRPVTLLAKRQASRLFLGVSGGKLEPQVDCDIPSTRAALGFVVEAGPSQLSQLRISRSPR